MCFGLEAGASGWLQGHRAFTDRGAYMLILSLHSHLLLGSQVGIELLGLSVA